MIVVDTNVLSELMRPRPDTRVMAWFEALETDDVSITAITVGEIRRGVERLPLGRRRDELTMVADRLLDGLADRVLPFDRPAAERWGVLMATLEREGRPIGNLDVQIASIVHAHRATLATRNVRDFDDCGITVVDPFA